MDNLSWVVDECIGELGKSVAPCDLLERLFADPRCPAFGADHHFIVGACLLTALALSLIHISRPASRRN